MERLSLIEDRIEATRPYPRVTPSRPENIRDEEVREIQRVIAEILPDTIVNSSTVVTGCTCEDGPTCSDQVWVIAYRPGRSKGVLLSRINGAWRVGPVQHWWLEYEKLERRFRADYNAEDAFKEQFPACLDKAAADRARPRG